MGGDQAQSLDPRMMAPALNAAQRLPAHAREIDLFEAGRSVDLPDGDLSTPNAIRPRATPTDVLLEAIAQKGDQAGKGTVADIAALGQPLDHQRNRSSMDNAPVAALTDSSDQATANADVREIADRKAAPLAIAFVAAGLFEQATENLTFLDGFLKIDALRKGRGPQDVQAMRPATLEVQEGTLAALSPSDATATLAPRGIVQTAGRQLASWVSSRAAPGAVTADTVDIAPIRRIPLSQFASSIQLHTGAVEAAADEQAINAEPRRAATAHSQRAELVASLLPVCVTLHAAGETIKLTVRMASGKSSDDPLEFRRMAAKMLSSEGFNLRGLVMNGNQEHASRRSQ
jgi:hypothetical protein